MRKKLPDQPQVQLLVNRVMPWAEAELRKKGRFSAAAAWLEAKAMEPEFRTIADSDPLFSASVRQQEAMLEAELRPRWQSGGLVAAILVAPVLYGRRGSEERSPAVRLHVEVNDGYCADILMPYRIRGGWRWRGTPGNRVHFSHPVAQESDSRFSGSPAPTQDR